MSSSATLPQELIDIIVEHLGLDRDIKSLIACLTVSKAFFPMARAWLWRDRFMGPYSGSRTLHPVKWSTDNIPESPILRSLVRSMRIHAVNWLFRNPENFWEDLPIVVDAFERVTHLEFDLLRLLDRIPPSPVIRKWHIVSLKLSFFGVVLQNQSQHTPAKSCAFFENFPMLNHLELRDPACMPADSTLCTTERHHKLPQPVSLTLRGVYDPTVLKVIVAGHLFSLKKLQTLEMNYTMDPDLLLAAVSDTVKELVIHTISGRGCSLLFHRAESIIFSLATKHAARDVLLWWTRVMHQNSSNNTVQRVTIEIQLHLEPGPTAPKIVCFPNVWTQFGTALGGLMALKELVIIYQPGRRDRIGNADDAETRAGVTKFLRGKLGAIIGPTRVRLAFIDRNV